MGSINWHEFFRSEDRNYRRRIVLHALTEFFIDKLISAPLGSVGLITALHPGTVTNCFIEACVILGRRGIIIHPHQLYKLAGVEFARVLIDDRPSLPRLSREGIDIIKTRIRVEGATSADLKWVQVPW